jgi:hypothetical protein
MDYSSTNKLIMKQETEKNKVSIWEAPMLIIEHLSVTEAGDPNSAHSDGINCRLS